MSDSSKQLPKGMYPKGAYLDNNGHVMVQMTLKVTMTLEAYKDAKWALATGDSGYTVRQWAESCAQSCIDTEDFVPDFMMGDAPDNE